MNEFEIEPISPTDYEQLSLMAGELLSEIMEGIHEQVFNFNAEETEKRAKTLIEDGKYWVFIAKMKATGEPIGFVSLYESYALYAEGAYGTIPELYVRPNWRSHHIGKKLLESVKEFAIQKDWTRLEVTTPPLPEFDRTLNFYETNRFEITGGRKLKLSIKS